MSVISSQQSQSSNQFPRPASVQGTLGGRARGGGGPAYKVFVRPIRTWRIYVDLRNRCGSLQRWPLDHIHRQSTIKQKNSESFSYRKFGSSKSHRIGYQLPTFYLPEIGENKCFYGLDDECLLALKYEVSSYFSLFLVYKAALILFFGSWNQTLWSVSQ